jgi:hypothetical protein
MTRTSIVTLASLSLLLACAKNEPSTETPGVAEPGAADGGAAEPKGERPQVRTTTTSGTADSGGGLQKAGPKARPTKLVAKKPPGGGSKGSTNKPPADVDPGTPVELSGFFPPTAGVGSRIEVYGTNFAPTAKQNTVVIGGKAQKVVDVFEDRLVVQLASEVSGPITVRKNASGSKYKRGHRGGAGADVTTAASFAALKKDGAFGRARTASGQGLIGTVYDIGKASTEVPDFTTLGTPVTYVAVDNLDIASGTFPQGFASGDGRITANYGVHFQGSLNVTEAGNYTLCLDAGDGALLYLDQQPIVDLDGTGDTRNACETIQIEPGEYGLDLLWYQNDGEMGLRLSWAKDGGAKTPIPATNLFPPDVAGLAAQIETAAKG